MNERPKKAGAPKKLKVQIPSRRTPPDKWDAISRQEWENLRKYVADETGNAIPSKIPTPLTDRPDPQEVAARASIKRQKHLDMLRVDPLGDLQGEASVFAPVIMQRESVDEFKMAGLAFCNVLKFAPVSDLKMFLENILALVINSEKPKAAAYAYLAYCRMIEERGSEPKSLSEIRDYMISRPEEFDPTAIPHPKYVTNWKTMFKQASIDLPWKQVGK